MFQELLKQPCENFKETDKKARIHSLCLRGDSVTLFSSQERPRMSLHGLRHLENPGYNSLVAAEPPPNQLFLELVENGVSFLYRNRHKQRKPEKAGAIYYQAEADEDETRFCSDRLQRLEQGKY